MTRYVVGTLVAATLLVLGLAVPASASEVNASGEVTAGQSVTLLCPDGEQAPVVNGNLVTSATFYRNAKMTKVLVTYDGSMAGGITDATGSVIVGAFFIAPKGARFYTAVLDCEPIPVPAP